jgi:AcrR family transcriptional regulator
MLRGTRPVRTATSRGSPSPYRYLQLRDAARHACRHWKKRQTAAGAGGGAPNTAPYADAVAQRAGERDQKERIRREAALLFARNGYQGTGIQALSEAVGLGRGALYHHIGSKEALFEEVSTRAVQEMIEIAEGIVSRPASATERIRLLCQAQIRTLADHQAEWTLFQRDAMTIRGDARDRIFATRARFEAIWRQLLEEGVENGEFRGLDPIVLKGILGMHNWAYIWLDPDGRLTPEEIGDMFCDMLLNGIVA